MLRRVIVGALAAMLLLAPSASGVPGDPTPPAISPVYSPLPPATGWYRGSVTLGWTVSDPESVVLNMSGCETKTYTDDTAGTKVTCTASSDGGENSMSVWVRVDKTPPAVTAAPSRVADANGWYNRALSVAFSGSDLTSGVVACSAPFQYAGPDNPLASVVGSCSDKAGNSTSAAFSFKYDGTAPTLFAISKKLGNRSAQLAWRKSTDTAVIEIARAPGRAGAGETVVYRGTATGFRDTGLVVGRKYEYRIAGIDLAANRGEQKLDLVATGALISPPPAARVKGAPFLVWTPVKKASYYNVQLVRGKKILSVWPARPGFRLRRTWSYNGRRYKLRPGVYRWYVWPGFGEISEADYGRLLGSSTFVVTK